MTTKRYISDRRLYLDKDGEVTDDVLKAKSLYVSKGKEIPEEVAKRFSGTVEDKEAEVSRESDEAAEDTETADGEAKEAEVAENKSGLGRMFPTAARSRANRTKK